MVPQLLIFTDRGGEFQKGPKYAGVILEQPPNLEYDFMSHTNEIGFLVSNPVNSVKMSIILIFLYTYVTMTKICNVY